MAKKLYKITPEMVQQAANDVKTSGVQTHWNEDYLNQHAFNPDDMPDFMQPEKIKEEQHIADTAGSGLPEGTPDYTSIYQKVATQDESLRNVGANMVGTVLQAGVAPAIENIKESLSQPVTENTYTNIYENTANLNNIPNETLNDIGEAVTAGVDMADKAIQTTRMYNAAGYMFDKEGAAIKAKEMGEMFDRDPAFFMNNEDAYVKAAQLLASYKIDSRVAPNVDRSDPVAFGQYLNEHYPELTDGDLSDFVVALNNIEDVKSVHSIGDAAKLAWDLYATQAESSDISRAAFLGKYGKYGSDYLPEEAIDRKNWLNQHYEELRAKIPSFGEHPLLNIFTQAAEQAGGMAEDVAKGAAIGGAAAAIAYSVPGVGLMAAKSAFATGMKYGSMAGMFWRQVGDKYIEYASYQDESGHALYTPDEARVRAAIETALETGIEFYNYDDIMRALSGSGRAAIKDIVMRNKGDKEAIMGGLRGYVKNSVKSWAPRVKEEVLEEGEQSLVDSAMKAYMLNAERPNNKEQKVTLSGAAGDALEAMYQSVPAVVGMVAGGDVISNVKAVRKVATIAQLHKQLNDEQIDNLVTMNTLKELKENQKDNKIFKKSPELYKKTVKETMSDAGMPYVYVDTEMLMKEEGGEQLINDLAKESGMTPEEVKAVVDAKADLKVPTDVYCQVALPSSLGDKAITMTTSSANLNCEARVKDTIARVQSIIQELSKKDDEERQQAVNNIVDNSGFTDDEKELAKEVLLSNPTNVQQGYKDAVKAAEEEVDAIIKPKIEQLIASSKIDDVSGGYRQIETEHFAEYQGRGEGLGVWESENGKRGEGGNNGFYSLDATNNKLVLNVKGFTKHRKSWWTDALGTKPPTVGELRQFAYDTLTGKKLGDMEEVIDRLSDEDIAQYEQDAADMKVRLDGLIKRRDTLRAMKDKMEKIDSVETSVTRGLSPEAYKVYRATAENLSQSKDKDVKGSARFSAIIFARMCQRLAEESVKQGKKVTALDIAKTITIDPNATKVQKGGYNQSGWHGSPYDFNAFDNSKMGSGEGAQVHGWGTYVAEDRTVSLGYKERLKQNNGVTLTVEGEEKMSPRLFTDLANAGKISPNLSGADNIIKALKEAAKDENYAEEAETWIDLIEDYKKQGKKVSLSQSKATLYKVDIPEESEMLDEQKGIHEQNIEVLRNLGKLDTPFSPTFLDLAKAFLMARKAAGKEGETAARKYAGDLINDVKFKTEATDHASLRDTIKDSETLKAIEKLLRDCAQDVKETERLRDGRGIYKELTSYFGHDPKNASLELNKAGIKGITYQGALDGRCYVIFDDKAIKILEKYYQQGMTVNGQTLKTSAGMFMNLFQTADKSTFVHESAHWYLIQMGSLAQNENVSEQFKQDYLTIQHWLGNKKIDDKISVKQHEKFARGFESYLREGKAPAPALRGVFSRFKTWLSQIYRDFVQLGGKPSKDVRQVMDRMLATKDEVDLAMKEQMVADFERAGGLKVAGKDVGGLWARWLEKVREEAEAKVMAQAMKDLEEQQKADIDKMVETEREKIEDELMEQPLWKANAIMEVANQDTETLAALGFTPEEYEAQLKEAGGSFDAAVQKELDGFRKELENDAVNSDLIAKSAKSAVQEAKYQEMLHALEYQALVDNAERLQAEEDDRREKEQKKAEREATRANAPTPEEKKINRLNKKLDTQKQKTAGARNDTRIAEEQLKGVQQGIRQVRDLVFATVKARRKQAHTALAKMPIGQAINVALWTKKLGQKQYEVYKLMSKGDWYGAVKAKGEQLMLAAIVTETGRLKARMDKLAGTVAKHIATIQKGNDRLPATERYYYVHMAYILGLSRVDGLEPAELKSLNQVFKEFAGQSEEEAPEVEIPDWINNIAKAKDRYTWQNLTPQQMELVATVMNALYQRGRDKENMHTLTDEKGKKLTINEVIDELTAEIAVNVTPDIKPDKEDLNTAKDKAHRQIRNVTDFLGSYFHKLVTPLTLLQRIDGYTGKTGKGVTGSAIKWLYDPIMKATNKETLLKADFAQKLTDIFSVYKNIDDLRNKAIYRFGERILTKEQVIALALNTGTESNYRRLLDNEPLGKNWQFGSINDRHDSVMNALAKLFESALDETDWQVVQKIWDLMGEHWADESKIKEDTTGIPLGKVTTRNFTVRTKDGKELEIKGGYYPIAYDAKQSVRAGNLETQDALKSMSPGALRMGQGKGFTKTRADVVTGRPLNLSFDVIARKGGEMMHYIAFREAALDVSRIINNKKFADAVVNNLGMESYKTLQNYASDVWAPPVQSGAWFDTVMRKVRTNTTAAVLAYRTSTMLLNAANAPLMIMYCGPGEFISAFKKFYADPKKNLQFVKSMSPFMAKRSERMDTNIREGFEQKHTGVTPLSIKDKIMQNGFKLIVATDNAFAYPLWYAEYMRTLNEGISEGKKIEDVQQDAIAAGDRAVVRILGSGDMKDLSPAQKGGELAKMLTMFYTFQNALYNMAANKFYAGREAARQKGAKGVTFLTRPEFIVPMAHFLLCGVMLNSAIEMGIRGAMDAASGRDDDKEKNAAYWFKRFVQVSIENQTATVPILRDIWRPISNIIFEGKPMFSPSTKMTSAFDSFARIVEGANTAEGYALGKKNLADMVRDGGRVITALAGAPDMIVDGASAALQYFLYDGGEHDLLDLMVAIAFDRKLPKPKKKAKKLTPYERRLRNAAKNRVKK